MPKLNTVKGFIKNQLIFSASYCKKYGIMCCIVLKTYYLCDVIGINRLISAHIVLKKV